MTASTGTSYIVSYNTNGGSANPANSSSTKTFSSWTLGGSGSISSTTTNTTTYTFGAGDGTLSANYSEQPSITCPTAPTKNGYIFNGWYTSASGETKRCDAGGIYTPTASDTLYAQWTAESYTITYD